TSGRSSSSLRPLYVYDTSSTGPPARVTRRLITVAREKRDGSRDVLELMELENPGVATRVARDTLLPTWAGAIPPVAIQFQVGQGDVSSQVVTRRGDSVAVYGPLPPRERKQLSYTYVLPATVRRVSVPIDQATDEVDLLLEDTTAVDRSEARFPRTGGHRGAPLRALPHTAARARCRAHDRLQRSAARARVARALHRRARGARARRGVRSRDAPQARRIPSLKAWAHASAWDTTTLRCLDLFDRLARSLQANGDSRKPVQVRRGPATV